MGFHDHVCVLLCSLLLTMDAVADHPESDNREWGVHPPCYNGTTKLGEMKNMCRAIHMTTDDKDNSVYGFASAGEWHHYHFVINDFEKINRPFGSKVHFQLEPCRGSIFLYVKPGMLFEGKPMMQMFETDPFGDEPGMPSRFWPFPDENTATVPQGPDWYLVEEGQEYPGPLFKVYPWGFKSENEGVMNGVNTKLVHGAYFISIYAQVDTDYRLGIYTTDNDADPDPSLTKEELDAIKDAEEKELEDRRKSTAQESIVTSYGRYSEITWLLPHKNLVFSGNDESKMWDLSQFDAYQLWYAMDSRTHYEPIQPRQVVPPAPLPAPIENEEMDAVQGYCSFNNSGNATSYHCIMETECGIRLNGLPYTEKLNKNWDEADYVLKKEVCKTTRAGPECTLQALHKEYMGKHEWVRYEIRRNKYSKGGDVGDPCGFPFYAADGFEHPASNYGEEYMCKQGLKCDIGGKGDFVCQKDYLEFKTMSDEEIDALQMYVVTQVPHHCWETGEQFCMKDSKRFDAPTIPVRRVLTVHSRDLAKGEIYFQVEGVSKLCKTLEEAIAEVWKLDGIYGDTIPEVSPNDVPKMRKRSDIHIVTRISGFRGNTTGMAALEMPCAQPWTCSMFTFRSRTLAINVERHKCLEIKLKNGIPKCSRFHIVPEVYVAAIGNTSFDKATSGGSDEEMAWIAVAICGFFGILIAAICFMRARTAIRLHLAYKHAAENLDGMPDAINPDKEKIRLKKQKEAQALEKKEQKLWEKQKRDRIKERSRKAKEMEKRMKKLEKEKRMEMKKQLKEKEKAAKEAKKQLLKQEKEANAHAKARAKLKSKEIQSIGSKMES